VKTGFQKWLAHGQLESAYQYEFFPLMRHGETLGITVLGMHYKKPNMPRTIGGTGIMPISRTTSD
jgi:hypothetical protein